jgi:predicted transcriptional regulator
MKKEKVKLTLELSPEMYGVLKNLSEETSSSKSEILRKALNLMEVAVTAKSHNYSLGILDKQDHIKSRIVGI